MNLPVASRRSVSSLVNRRATPSVFSNRSITLPKNTLRSSFRRGYADAPKAVLSPQPKPKKRFRFLRWTWRITYLSFLGVVGFTAWSIWEGRNPSEQYEPDPNKKTLVILGKDFIQPWKRVEIDQFRYWLGFRVTIEKARYWELQCCRRFTTKLLPLHPSPSLLHRRNHRTSINHGTD